MLCCHCEGVVSGSGGEMLFEHLQMILGMAALFFPSLL